MTTSCDFNMLSIKLRWSKNLSIYFLKTILPTLFLSKILGQFLKSQMTLNKAKRCGNLVSRDSKSQLFLSRPLHNTYPLMPEILSFTSHSLRLSIALFQQFSSNMNIYICILNLMLMGVSLSFVHQCDKRFGHCWTINDKTKDDPCLKAAQEQTY